MFIKVRWPRCLVSLPALAATLLCLAAASDSVHSVWAVRAADTAPLADDRAGAGQTESASSKARASKKAGKPAARSPAKKNPPVFYLRDGGKVAGAPRLAHLSVRTRYGLLRIPTEDLIQVRFSTRVDPDVERRVSQSIDKMGSDDFDVREEAMDEIRKIGTDAIAQLSRAIESDNEEIKNRAEILVEELESEEDDKNTVTSEMKAVQGDQDEIVTKTMTIKGLVVESRFTVESRYGPLELAAAHLVGVRFRFGGKISRSFDVDGGKTVTASWVNTRLNVIKGQPLRITAKGSLRVSNYNLTSGPGGTRRYSGSTFQKLPMLSLVGKVGSKGKGFLIGPSFRGKAPASGMLYLGVVPFRTYRATGTYKVKVESGS
ncbi:MAG: hypothetical protein O7J95_05560 [Planctomycetota bacterium]|nr:hypothetical protein [Planctomycetota bacterium]